VRLATTHGQRIRITERHVRGSERSLHKFHNCGLIWRLCNLCDKKETVTAFDVSRAHWWRRLGCFKGAEVPGASRKGNSKRAQPRSGECFLTNDLRASFCSEESLKRPTRNQETRSFTGTSVGILSQRSDARAP
jgi:hypothetical protein